jgi:hypothetical protein
MQGRRPTEIQVSKNVSWAGTLRHGSPATAGYGPKYADMICAIMPTKAGLTLGIARATQLPDPEGLLQGTGKVHRHVKLKSESEVKAATLKALLKAAIAAYQHSGTRQPPPVAT